MNRRDLLKCLAAGGAVVAGELWIPGQRVISIPSGRVFGSFGGKRLLMSVEAEGYILAAFHPVFAPVVDSADDIRGALSIPSDGPLVAHLIEPETRQANRIIV